MPLSEWCNYETLLINCFSYWKFYRSKSKKNRVFREANGDIDVLRSLCCEGIYFKVVLLITTLVF